MGNVRSTNDFLSSSLFFFVITCPKFAGILYFSLQGIKFFSRSHVWQIVSSLAPWVIWKARCSKRYNDENIHIVDQVKSFWDLLVHKVKGEYDSYKGFGHKTNKKRMRIRKVWSSIPIMLNEDADVKWNYVPPRWLFPPPTPL